MEEYIVFYESDLFFTEAESHQEAVENYVKEKAKWKQRVYHRGEITVQTRVRSFNVPSIAFARFVGAASRKGLADIHECSKAFLYACDLPPIPKPRYKYEYTSQGVIVTTTSTSTSSERSQIRYLQEQNRILEAQLTKRFKIKLVYVLLFGISLLGYWVLTG